MNEGEALLSAYAVKSVYQTLRHRIRLSALWGIGVQKKTKTKQNRTRSREFINQFKKLAAPAAQRGVEVDGAPVCFALRWQLDTFQHNNLVTTKPSLSKSRCSQRVRIRTFVRVRLSVCV